MLQRLLEGNQRFVKGETASPRRGPDDFRPLAEGQRPVAVIMFFAMRGNWGTHYDVLPPEYTGPTSFWGEYFAIALVPQLVFWVAFTITTGSLFGSVASAVAHRGKAAAHATS